jgi:MYXO-CTERM domain-containing protein
MTTRTSGARSATRRSSSSNGAGPGRDRSADGRAESNVKEVAGKATAPALVAGAAVVGLLALRRRRRRTKVLGLALPRSFELELTSLAKTIGNASKEFGKTSKNVSKDIERLGDQAERIGKILS